ncbi:hypothetical protein PR048_015075 [Dryococelus australis]|uniref:Uncharacterized protein n=1 Tax=Dryococelus australis TaxID=614101 RepID=A0ABQ9HG41_9NEOP|nr:hypothetical protein PR048_015075 [Dryococelus australis]
MPVTMTVLATVVSSTGQVRDGRLRVPNTAQFEDNFLKRVGVHVINRGRQVFGEYHHLFPQLKRYKMRIGSYTRMEIDTFNYMLDNIEESLTKIGEIGTSNQFCQKNALEFVFGHRFVIQDTGFQLPHGFYNCSVDSERSSSGNLGHVATSSHASAN